MGVVTGGGIKVSPGLLLGSAFLTSTVATIGAITTFQTLFSGITPRNPVSGSGYVIIELNVGVLSPNQATTATMQFVITGGLSPVTAQTAAPTTPSGAVGFPVSYFVRVPVAVGGGTYPVFTITVATSIACTVIGATVNIVAA